MVDTGTNSGRIARAAAFAAIVIGVCVLAGWLFDFEPLKRIASGFIAMNPATAIAFILSGASLAFFLQPRRGPDQKSKTLWAARLCAFLVALIGVSKLAGLVSGWDLGVDRWFFGSKLEDGLRSPNRIAPNTALSFILLGSALLWADVKTRSVRFCVEGAAVLVGFGSLLAVLVYAYDIESFYGIEISLRMALHTAITFFILAVALLLSHTDSGLLAIFVGDSAGGTMARRLLPAAVLVPAVLGWLTHQAEIAGIYRGALSDAVFAVGIILVFTFLVCWSAKELFSADRVRQESEDALQESEARFSEAFEHAPIGVALISPDGRWLQVNRALCDLIGYSEAELQTRTILDITHSEDADLSRESVRRAISGESGSLQIENRYIHKRGHLITVLLNISLVRDAQGLPRYCIAQIQDITERKQAEKALRESHERFQQLADNITDAFWIRSPDLREVHYLSPAFERIWGRSVESLCANPQQWSEFVLPEDRERALGALTSLTQNTASVDLEYRILRPDGEIRWVRVRGYQIRDAADTLIRLTGIVTDITERKRIEAQLFQSQKLETVGKLAGGIAHEFNSLLTAIIGQSELILDDLPPGHPLSQNAAAILKTAERAATLTRQLLAYGRRTFLRPAALDLNQVILRMQGALRHLMGQAVEVRILPAAGLHAVKADAAQIEQVIMNLALNAGDAMPEAGTLTLQTANVSLDQESIGPFPDLKPGPYATLAITDTGTGMSDEIKARAFEPFFTTKDIGQGTGLGLSTCYGIIKQSGGHISVASAPGRGTTFTIYLPQIEPPPKTPLRQ